jgi:hypothetical protein
VRQQNKRYVSLAEQQQVIEEALEPLSSVCILLLWVDLVFFCVYSIAESDGADQLAIYIYMIDI